MRLGLARKGVAHRLVPVHLRRGDQLGADYRAVNPAGLVPALDIGGRVLTQSLAILDYLDETAPEPPLLPADPLPRAEARALALTLAADSHPVNNLRVQQRLRGRFGADDAAVRDWVAHWCYVSLDAFAALLPQTAGRFCMGDEPLLPDIVLVPHLASARRFGTDLSPWPRLLAIEAAFLAEPWVEPTLPRNQPDWEDVP